MFQVLQSNTNDSIQYEYFFQAGKCFQVFLSNTNNSIY